MTAERSEQDDYDNAAEALSALLDRPKSDFDASAYVIPNFEDQEITTDE